MKPTSRPISHCARSRLNPFLYACDAIALQPNLQRSASHSLVGWSTLRPRLTRHPASPRPHAANEENAALRKAIEDADYEYGVGLLRLNQLDLVTVVASSATVPKKRNCAFTRSNSSRNLDFLNAFASPLQVAKRSNCAFSTVRGQRLSPAVDNDSLEVTTSTRSRTRSSRRDGRCACHARPSTRRRGWTSSATEWRCSTRTAAMAPRCAYVPPHTPATVGGATRSDPQLLSIASSGSPECRMRCAIAHF